MTSSLFYLRYNASLITFSQTYLVGIANTTLYFNTSEGGPVTTCSPYTDRVLPPSDTLSTPRSSSDNLRGKHLLPRTTAQALGAFPSFQLHDTHADGFPRLNWFAPQGNQLSATAFGRFAKAGQCPKTTIMFATIQCCCCWGLVSARHLATASALGAVLYHLIFMLIRATSTSTSTSKSASSLI